ncbi:calponin homology domain-containing protein, partial [Pelagophyceae sp. CCMP2097]
RRRALCRYINSKLAGRSLVVGDLYEDLKSGVLLYHFLEVLTGENLKQYGKLNSGKMRIQHVANMNVVFKFFPDADIKLENIGVMDIVDGNPTSVLGLIWSIIAFYLVKQLGDGGDGDNLAGIKQKILRWCKARASPKVPVTNLTDSFADGRAFLAILNKTDNAGSPYVPEADPCANFRTAFADAEAKYGVPQMLTPDDPDLYTDEISMLTYLSEMMAKLPDNVAQPVRPPPYPRSPPVSALAAQTHALYLSSRRK